MQSKLVSVFTDKYSTRTQKRKYNINQLWNTDLLRYFPGSTLVQPEVFLLDGFERSIDIFHSPLRQHILHKTNLSGGLNILSAGHHFAPGSAPLPLFFTKLYCSQSGWVAHWTRLHNYRFNQVIQQIQLSLSNQCGYKTLRCTHHGVNRPPAAARRRYVGVCLVLCYFWKTLFSRAGVQTAPTDERTRSQRNEL